MTWPEKQEKVVEQIKVEQAAKKKFWAVWRPLVPGAVQILSCCCSRYTSGGPCSATATTSTTASVAAPASGPTPTSLAAAPATHRCATTTGSWSATPARTIAAAASCSSGPPTNRRHSAAAGPHTKDTKTPAAGHSRGGWSNCNQKAKGWGPKPSWN